MPAEFDPQAPFVDRQYLQYANFAAFIAGEPLENTRNSNIGVYRRFKYTEAAIQAYAEAFDREALRLGHKTCPPPSRDFAAAHAEGIEAATLTGGFTTPARRLAASPLSASIAAGIGKNTFLRRLLDSAEQQSPRQPAHDDHLDAFKYAFASAKEVVGLGAGAGQPRAVAATLAPLRKAPESEVPGGLGPRGHLPTT